MKTVNSMCSHRTSRLRLKLTWLRGRWSWPHTHHRCQGWLDASPSPPLVPPWRSCSSLSSPPEHPGQCTPHWRLPSPCRSSILSWVCWEPVREVDGQGERDVWLWAGFRILLFGSSLLMACEGDRLMERVKDMFGWGLFFGFLLSGLSLLMTCVGDCLIEREKGVFAEGWF